MPSQDLILLQISDSRYIFRHILICLPAARYVELIILTDEPHSYYMTTLDHMIETNINQSWVLNFSSGVVNQEINGNWITKNVGIHRGVRYHSLTYLWICNNPSNCGYHEDERPVSEYPPYPAYYTAIIKAVESMKPSLSIISIELPQNSIDIPNSNFNMGFE